jgi:F0F1-type ATP synthase assembly protein I
MALAASWSAMITTISMEMVVPIALGYWIDTWLGTRVVFVILGAIGGMTLGMFHLVRLLANSPAKKGKLPPRSETSGRQ